MPRDYSATELIASIRQRSFTAGAPRDFDDPSVLRLLNELATSYLLKLIAKRNTNYLVESVDLSVTTAASSYPVPSVAIAGAVRAVTLIVAGIPTGLVEMSLPQAVQTNMAPWSVAFPTGYYWQGPNVVLWPSQAIAGTLRLHYHRRPSQIVLPAACVKIASFPGGAAAGNYRIGYTGSAVTGYSNGVAVDVVSNIPNFYRWQTNTTIAATGVGTIDIVGTLPAGLAVGDWICLYDTAPVVTDSPAEVIDCLLSAVFVGMMEGKGSKESLERAEKQLARAEASAGPLIQQRNTGAMRKISAFPDAGGFPWAGG